MNNEGAWKKKGKGKIASKTGSFCFGLANFDVSGSNPTSNVYLLVDIGENGEADSNVKVSLQDSWTEQETNVLRYSRGAGYFDVLRFRILGAVCSLSTIFSKRTLEVTSIYSIHP